MTHLVEGPMLMQYNRSPPTASRVLVTLLKTLQQIEDDIKRLRLENVVSSTKEENQRATDEDIASNAVGQLDTIINL